jgi:predicted transposase YbfD/YdcC
MASLIEKLGEFPAPRRGNAQRHALLDILTSALVASVCGAESCVDFADFAQDRETLLRELLSLKEGLPSHDIFSGVCRLLDPAGFARAFEAFPDDLGVDGDGVLAIAGQDAAPSLRPGGDRRAVLREVAAFFADPPAPRAVVETTDADHGRIETRRHRITRSVDWLFSDRRHAGEPRLPGLACIACVEATRTEAGKTTRSTRFYPSSAKLAPETFARAVRGHRADREQPATSVLDVPFDEDRARNRRDNGAENLAILRRLTLNRLNKARPGMSLARSATAPVAPTPSQEQSSAECDRPA